MGETSGERPQFSLKDKFEKLFKKKSSNPVSEQLQKINDGIGQLTELQKNTRTKETPEEEDRRITEEIETNKSDDEIYAAYKMKEVSNKKQRISAQMNNCSNTQLLVMYLDLQQIYEHQYNLFKLTKDNEASDRIKEFSNRIHNKIAVSLGIDIETKQNNRNTKRPNETPEDRLKRILEEKKNQRSPAEIKMDEVEEQMNRTDITLPRKIFLFNLYKKLHQRNLDDYTKKFLESKAGNKDSE